MITFETILLMINKSFFKHSTCSLIDLIKFIMLANLKVFLLLIVFGKEQSSIGGEFCAQKCVFFFHLFFCSYFAKV